MPAVKSPCPTRPTVIGMCRGGRLPILLTCRFRPGSRTRTRSGPASGRCILGSIMNPAGTKETTAPSASLHSGTTWLVAGSSHAR